MWRIKFPNTITWFFIIRCGWDILVYVGELKIPWENNIENDANNPVFALNQCCTQEKGKGTTNLWFTHWWKVCLVDFIFIRILFLIKLQHFHHHHIRYMLLYDMGLKRMQDDHIYIYIIFIILFFTFAHCPKRKWLRCPFLPRTFRFYYIVFHICMLFDFSKLFTNKKYAWKLLQFLFPPFWFCYNFSFVPIPLSQLYFFYKYNFHHFFSQCIFLFFSQCIFLLRGQICTFIRNV